MSLITVNNMEEIGTARAYWNKPVHISRTTVISSNESWEIFYYCTVKYPKTWIIFSEELSGSTICLATDDEQAHVKDHRPLQWYLTRWVSLYPFDVTVDVCVLLVVHIERSTLCIHTRSYLLSGSYRDQPFWCKNSTYVHNACTCRCLRVFTCL